MSNSVEKYHYKSIFFFNMFHTEHFMKLIVGRHVSQKYFTILTVMNRYFSGYAHIRLFHYHMMVHTHTFYL